MSSRSTPGSEDETFDNLHEYANMFFEDQDIKFTREFTVNITKLERVCLLDGS